MTENPATGPTGDGFGQPAPSVAGWPAAVESVDDRDGTTAAPASGRAEQLSGHEPTLLAQPQHQAQSQEPVTQPLRIPPTLAQAAQVQPPQAAFQQAGFQQQGGFQQGGFQQPSVLGQPGQPGSNGLPSPAFGEPAAQPSFQPQQPAQPQPGFPQAGYPQQAPVFGQPAQPGPYQAQPFPPMPPAQGYQQPQPFPGPSSAQPQQPTPYPQPGYLQPGPAPLGRPVLPPSAYVPPSLAPQPAPPRPPMPGPPGMLAGAADRERAIDVVKAAFGEGRLTKEEFDQRVHQITMARTYGDLAVIISDLPAGPLGGLAQYPAGVPVAAPYYPPAPQPTNGLAIGSLVCALLGISLPAVIMGHIARRQIREENQAGDSLAVAGLVIGWLGVAFYALMFLVLARSGQG